MVVLEHTTTVSAPVQCQLNASDATAGPAVQLDVRANRLLLHAHVATVYLYLVVKGKDVFGLPKCTIFGQQHCLPMQPFVHVRLTDGSVEGRAGAGGRLVAGVRGGVVVGHSSCEVKSEPATCD
jgi:hypothetical protein